MGFGKLNAKGKIEVTAADNSKQTVEAKHIIIATGGRAAQLPSMPMMAKRSLVTAKQWCLPNNPKP